jgi:type VI secretion system protein ImpL
MQAAIKRAPDYYNREPWVLGDAGKDEGGAADLSVKLSDKYTAEYLRHWQEFLDGASVLRYAGWQDASTKLRRLSGAESPLLSLFCIAAENTSVDSAAIAAAFKPVHGLTPPGACATSPIGPSNSEYMGSLLALQVEVERLAEAKDA